MNATQINAYNSLGHKIGQWTEYGVYSLGFFCTLATTAQGMYENGERIGIWEFFSKDGFLSFKIEYKDGIVNGLATSYHFSGLKRWEIIHVR